MKIYHEEQFGPIVPIVSYTHIEEIKEYLGMYVGIIIEYVLLIIIKIYYFLFFLNLIIESKILLLLLLNVYNNL